MKRLSEVLEEYSQSDILPMHMPGHKRNKKMNMRNPYSLDVTEVRGMDNLHKPEGAILVLMSDLTKWYHSEQSYILVNGSTGGLLAAITACCHHGDSIAIARNCHTSVYHAIQLLELKPEYLFPDGEGGDLRTLGIAGSIRPDDVRDLLIRNPEVKCIVITSPTYEGIVSPIREIATVAHEYGVALIVDEAHGAHFNWHKDFPETAVQQGADLVVESLHKTLPSFTQTAILHADFTNVSRERLEWCLRTYQSSSPSYILMAGIDRCFAYIEREGQRDYPIYVQNLKEFRDKMTSLNKLYLFHSDNQEISKLVFATDRTTMSGKQFADQLFERFGIETEMSCGNYCIAMTSVCDEKESFERLAAAVFCLDREASEAEINQTGFHYIWEQPTRVLFSYQAADCEKEIVDLSNAKGRTAAEDIYLYPPGIPLVVAGEMITDHIVTLLQIGDAQGYTVQGAENGVVSVVKQEKRLEGCFGSEDIMGRLFVIMGKSATGKDSLYQRIVKDHPELNEVVSYTTRPIRSGEVYGKEYFFVSKEEMYEMREENKIVECRKYDTVLGPWFYFTADDGQIDFSKGDYILISTLEGYEKLQQFFGIDNIVPVYIEVDDFVRLERAVNRERNQVSPCVPELCRRFLADEQDFSEDKLQMAGIDTRIVNDDFERAVENIEKLIQSR